METAVRCVWHMYSGTSAIITTTILFPLVLQLLFLNYHYTYADTLLSPLTNIPTADGRKCSPNLVTQGITFPEGDILVEYGDPLEIYCILNPKITDRNSSSLIFDVDGNQVDQKYLQIINNTTLRLYIDKPTPSKGMYYCRLKAEPEHHRNESLVCLNTVAVGFRPTEIDDFTCVSMNWENLTCTWSLPTNYVTTITKLEYFLQGRAGGRFSFQCPDSMDELEHRCFWDRSTPVVYRQPYEYYIFKMTFSNVFGNLTQKFKWYHYAHVIPSKPVNYTIINKTSHSVLITWSVGFPMQNFPPGVMQRVEYQSQWDSRDTWHVVDTSHLDNKSKTHVLNITDLKYAHSVYDIRIYMASPVATRKDKWSKPATIVVKTLPTEPSAPPKTDIGSFEVSRGIPSRDIYVYWQQIPEYMYNGDDFEYHVFIVDINGKESLLKPDEIKKSYARFKTFGFGEYHLKVYACNEIGYSATGSDLYIPATQNVISEPLTFTKIAFEDGIYELSWKQPPGQPKIDNYTIFWCDNKMDRPYQCTGYLNWLHVKNETFIKNITVHEDNVYQFAISANSRNSSSGMVWASCTVIHNKVVGKIKSVWISNIGSTFIELGWKLECSDRVGVITGYRIHYCPIVSPGEDACRREGFSNTTVLGDPPLTAHGNVTGLIPYTTYKLAITVLTKSGEGLPSDYLYNTTLEDAPDPPRNLRVIELTNTSMTLEWDPPLNKNGALRNYNVYYNNNHADVPLLPLLNPNVDPNLPVKKKLENLQSYYNYNISVSACTVTCSPHSVARSVRTLTGMPGIVEQPFIKTDYINKTEVMVSWNFPHNPRGPIDYYEVMVTHSNESKNDSKIHRVFKNSAVIEMQCDQMENVGQQFLVSVRAVNIRPEDNATFVGQWSSPGSRSCFNTGLPKSLQALVVIFVVMAVIALVFGLAYCTRWSLEKCKKAMDVGVSLPPELDPKVTKIVKESLDCQTRMHNWPPDNRKKDPELNDMFNPPPDQELLLLKKESECDGDGDGDSSGCSSAPSDDSVSSSLTSGTHISDSGTEADQRAESPDGIYMEESSPPPTSLRQRNVSSNRDEARLLPPYVTLGGALSTDNVSLNNSEPDPGYPGYLTRGTGYSRVGNPQPAQKGYVSYVPPTNIPKPSIPARGYVSQAPVWPEGKDASTPPAAASPLPAPASKGYVVAGSVPVVQQATAAKLPSSMSYCRLGTTSNYVTLPSTSKDASNV